MSIICKDCGTAGDTKTITRGYFGVELLLWLCFLLPGLIYSVWRISSRYEACPACGSENLLPIDSPIGQQVAQSTGHVPDPVRRPSSGASSLGFTLGRMAGRWKK